MGTYTIKNELPRPAPWLPRSSDGQSLSFVASSSYFFFLFLFFLVCCFSFEVTRAISGFQVSKPLVRFWSKTSGATAMDAVVALAPELVLIVDQLTRVQLLRLRSKGVKPASRRAMKVFPTGGSRHLTRGRDESMFCFF